MSNSNQHASMTTKITVMLEMQDAMNRKVHDDWFERDLEWYRAIWVECAEMLDHYGWKWWKHQLPDLEQVKLELVDVFHFGLSCRIDREQSLDAIAAVVADEFASPKKGKDFRVTLEMLASSALTEQRFDVGAFAGCMAQVDMSFAELYRSYVGKNTLNFFRQDHGYKDGSYQKVWSGREDNEWLVEILQKLNIDSPEFARDVYKGLKSAYPS